MRYQPFVLNSFTTNTSSEIGNHNRPATHSYMQTHRPRKQRTMRRRKNKSLKIALQQKLKEGLKYSLTEIKQTRFSTMIMILIAIGVISFIINNHIRLNKVEKLFASVKSFA